MAAGGAGVPAAAGPHLPLGLWSCPVRQLTGIPCPTCYLTRSILAALRGDLPQALQWHALGPIVLVVALALLGWTLLGGRPSARSLLQGSCALALLGLGYWLLRLWGWSHGQPLPGSADVLPDPFQSVGVELDQLLTAFHGLAVVAAAMAGWQ